VLLELSVQFGLFDGELLGQLAPGLEDLALRGTIRREGLLDLGSLRVPGIQLLKLQEELLLALSIVPQQVVEVDTMRIGRVLPARVREAPAGDRYLAALRFLQGGHSRWSPTRD
jgi:hypothetical protein